MSDGRSGGFIFVVAESRAGPLGPPTFAPGPLAAVAVPRCHGGVVGRAAAPPRASATTGGVVGRAVRPPRASATTGGVAFSFSLLLELTGRAAPEPFSGWRPPEPAPPGREGVLMSAP